MVGIQEFKNHLIATQMQENTLGSPDRPNKPQQLKQNG